MTPFLLQSITAAALAFVAGLLFIRLLIRYSRPLGLLDKPNARKLHQQPIPVVGGIAITAATLVAVPVAPEGAAAFRNDPALWGGALMLLVIGVWDDRRPVRPLYRLLLQFACAGILAASGIRLHSLHGIFGIGPLPVVVQYLLTMFIMVGVTNAFNLMDGIDGLAGGLALINLAVLSVLSYYSGEKALFSLLLLVTGALLAFLRFNFHPARIFMGDGGSLLLGFLMSGIGIRLIEQNAVQAFLPVHQVIILVCAILVVPVFDSIRVYAWRIRRGQSPFRPDRSHLHHLFLLLGLNHRRTAFYIYALELLIVALGLLFERLATLSAGLLLSIALFWMVGQLLQLNHQVEKWTGEIRKMEELV